MIELRRLEQWRLLDGVSCYAASPTFVPSHPPTSVYTTKPAANAATLGGTRRRADGVESAPPALRVSGHGRAVPRSVLASCRLKVLGLSRVTARIYVGDRLFT